MIDLHFVPSPNGHKVSILLEETGLPYRMLEYDLFKGEQLSSEYRKVNPNMRLPALVDHDPIDGAEPVVVFESGACLVYLAEKAGDFLSAELRPRMQAMQWVMWQMAGLGPMAGQAHHFIRYAPESNEYSKMRYLNETNRLLDVLDYRLGQEAYLAGEYSIADIACWPWVRANRLISVEIGDRRNLRRWFDEIATRPAVVRGARLPEDSMQAGPANQRVELDAEQWSGLFGDKVLRAAKEL